MSYEELIEKNGCITVKTKGKSMEPTLVEGRDTVIIEKASFPLKRGDAILFRRKNGEYVLHRVIKSKNGAYTLRGDNQIYNEHGITNKMIIGIMTGYYREKEYISSDNKKYRFYVFLRMNTYLFRRFCCHVKGFFVKQKYVTQKRESGNLIKALCTSLTNAVLGANEPLEATDYENLFALSESHHVANIVYEAIKNNPEVPSDIMNKFSRRSKLDSAREAYRFIETESIKSLFGKNGIDYIFLKGYELSSLYPSPQMRSMTDIDVLVRESDMKQATSLLKKSGYIFDNDASNKDIVFHKKPFIELELHKWFTDGTNEAYDTFCKKAFKRAESIDGEPHRYRYTLEDFYVLMIIHIASHFRNSGVGIRPILDVWLFNRRYNDLINCEAVNERLRSISLTTLNNNIIKLCDFAFERRCEGEADETTRSNLLFIIKSGTYGTLNNRENGREESKPKKLIRLFFPRFSDMALRYPTLKKHPYLLPAFWFARIPNIIAKSRTAPGRIKSIMRTSKSESKNMKALYKKNGL